MSDDSWLGDLFLGREGRQLRDIRLLRDHAAATSRATHNAAYELEILQRRVDRLQLVCETLLHVVLQRGVVDRDELARIMTRVDLRDGREDGGLSGDEPAFETPLCRICELPINPKRDACVYCDTKIVVETRVDRKVRCTRCGTEVDEGRSMFSETGVVCDACHTA